MELTVGDGGYDDYDGDDDDDGALAALSRKRWKWTDFFCWSQSKCWSAQLLWLKLVKICSGKKNGKKVTDFETDKKAEGRCGNKQKSSFRCFSEARTDNALTAKMPQKKTNCHLKNQAKRREKIGFNCHKLRGDNLHNFHMCSWPICLALHASRLLFALAQQMTLLTLCVCPSLFPRFFLACV